MLAAMTSWCTRVAVRLLRYATLAKAPQVRVCDMCVSAGCARDPRPFKTTEAIILIDEMLNDMACAKLT